MLTTLLTGILALKPLVCPVMGGDTTPKNPYTDRAGIRYYYCCPMCKGAFENNAKTVIASAQKRGGTFGLSLTDPITHRRINSAQAIASSDYKGIRYLFASKANKATFDKAHAPKTDPYATTATVGKYQIELRIPEEGLFAGTTVDVEFRLSDLTQNDPIEGKKGVPEAAPTATVTMPAMAGMPVMKPRIHSEGVPGDYGLELFFPHGGDFKVGLRLTPPGDKPIYASFLLPVKDAEARTAPAPQPYAVELLDLPKEPKAGEPIHLKVAIEDTKTGQRVTKFDVSHTKLLHLMLVSKDLGWFVHEHPQPQPDGTFTLDWTFPAGGDYLVFADVAPKDKGAQILSVPLKLAGPTKVYPRLAPTMGPSRDGTIVADLIPQEKPIPIGRSTELAFRLRDAQTGKPVKDLEPYLGAQGHLMIVHQDGGTFVHSHPAEDAGAQTGEVRFNARFPRPGLYKAWAQFQRAGKIATVSFVFEVK